MEKLSLQEVTAPVPVSGAALARCIGLSDRYGLRLTEAQLAALWARRQDSLRAAGRVELGEGITEPLLRAFASSPFLFADGCETTLAELQELFYQFKNAAEQPDDELLTGMRVLFDTWAGGSAERLADASPRRLARAARGLTDEEAEDDGK